MSVTDATFAVAQAVEKLAKAIDAHRESVDQLIMSVNFQRANVVPGKPGAVGSNPTGPAIPDVEMKLEWKPFKDKPGHWTFSKSNPLLRDTLLAAPNKTLEHGGFKYRLSGEQDMFLQRLPAGSGK